MMEKLVYRRSIARPLTVVDSAPSLDVQYCSPIISQVDSRDQQKREEFTEHRDPATANKKAPAFKADAF
jgi:hypothetical protein